MVDQHAADAILLEAAELAAPCDIGLAGQGQLHQRAHHRVARYRAGVDFDFHFVAGVVAFEAHACDVALRVMQQAAAHMTAAEAVKAVRAGVGDERQHLAYHAGDAGIFGVVQVHADAAAFGQFVAVQVVQRGALSHPPATVGQECPASLTASA